jgi:hypothetical protein
VVKAVNQKVWAGLPLRSDGNRYSLAPITPPTAIARTVDSSTQITLQASGGSSSLGSNAGYRYRRDGVLLNSVATASAYVDSGRSANTQYSYTATLVDSAGNESAVSAAFTALTPPASDIIPPTVPVITATALSQNSIRITLTTPSTDSGSGFRDYTLQAAITQNGPWVDLLTAVQAASFPHTHSGLTASSIRYYRVTAFDVAGNSSTSAVVQTATLGNPSEQIIITSSRASRTPLTFHMPLPDNHALSFTYCRHRLARAGFEWTHPICVEGGSFPYTHTVSGAPGMEVRYSPGYSIGLPPYYAYLYWANPSIGTHQVTITSRDQVNAVVTRTFTIVVRDANDTNYFLHFDSVNGNNANPGTPAQPKRDFGGWYLGNINDATHANKQCFYQGVFNVGGVAGCVYSSGVRLRMTNGKPKIHGSYGTGYTLRGNGAYIGFESSATQYWADGVYEDPATPTAGGFRNQHFYGGWAGGGTFRMTFRGSNNASVSGSNPSCLMNPDPVSTHQWTFHVGNVFDGVHGQACIKNYNVLDSYLEGWEVKNTSFSDSQVIHHKGGDIRRIIARGFKCIENNTNLYFEKDEWIADPVARHGLELSWSNIIAGTFGRVFGGDTVDNFQDNDNFRNNIREERSIAGSNSGIWTISDEVRQHSAQLPNGIQQNGSMGVVINSSSIAQSGLLDPVTNQLIGTARTQFLGLRGCEWVRV